MHARSVTLALGSIIALLAVGCRARVDAPHGALPAALADAAATPTTAVSPTPTPVPNDPYPAGAIGYAISWPQCGGPYPEEPFAFGIIGVTYGWAFSRNPCFAEEYRWAQRGQYHPSIYMNTNYVASKADIPGLSACGADASCRAFRYGRAEAEDAYAYATSVDAVARIWWLDVQIVSEWSDDVSLNAASVRGATEYLQSKGVRVGISSTAFQWATVAGEAQHGRPVWDASALEADMAARFCHDGKDFAGGRTEQVAYVAEGFETVLACGAAAPPSAR
jgi:hypothetical protein